MNFPGWTGFVQGGRYAVRMKKKSRNVNGAKASPAQGLKAVMAARRKSQAEISELREMLVEKSARQVELETTGNLGEVAVVNEIGGLQVLVKLLPRRIAFKEKEEAKAEETLVAATNEFIREHWAARSRLSGADAGDG